MTVNTKKITSGPYAGNDIADTFSYGFRVSDKTELIVFETDDDGVQTELTVDTDYTVNTIGNDSGGTITRIAGALPTNYEWYIRSNYEETQLAAFTSQGAFFPDIHENAMDKLTFLIQQILDKKGRSPSVPIGYSGELPITLESPVEGLLLQWESGGLVNFDMIGYADNGDAATLSAANNYADNGDAATLSAANNYTDENLAGERVISDSKYVDVTGDDMAGGLNVVDSLSSSSAMPKLSIVNAIDVAINQIAGVIGPGIGADYGFITEQVTEIIDYGSLT